MAFATAATNPAEGDRHQPFPAHSYRPAFWRRRPSAARRHTITDARLLRDYLANTYQPVSA